MAPATTAPAAIRAGGACRRSCASVDADAPALGSVPVRGTAVTATSAGFLLARGTACYGGSEPSGTGAAAGDGCYRRSPTSASDCAGQGPAPHKSWASCNNATAVAPSPSSEIVSGVGCSWPKGLNGCAVTTPDPRGYS